MHQVLDKHSVNGQRVPSFPAVAASYYSMALRLFPEAEYEHIFAVVTQAGVGQIIHQQCPAQDWLRTASSTSRTRFCATGQCQRAAAYLLFRDAAVRFYLCLA